MAEDCGNCSPAPVVMLPCFTRIIIWLTLLFFICLAETAPIIEGHSSHNLHTLHKYNEPIVGWSAFYNNLCLTKPWGNGLHALPTMHFSTIPPPLLEQLTWCMHNTKPHLQSSWGAKLHNQTTVRMLYLLFCYSSWGSCSYPNFCLPRYCLLRSERNDGIITMPLHHYPPQYTKRCTGDLFLS